MSIEELCLDIHHRIAGMNKRGFVIAVNDNRTVPLNMSIKRHQAQAVIEPERGARTPCL